jgi:non-ribosomal peptide synthase protein (TIGR01720 family)
VKVPLRVVMMSGDWIPVSLPGRIRQWLGNEVRLISMGGATEAAIWSIVYEIGEVEASWESIPYGKAMVNQRFHVLNEGLEPCPVWVPGELYIGGVGLAQGYWRDEEKTRSRFIEHPRTKERLYRTGDLGRFLPDGNIEFLGREDFQVKVHGHRIELGEIEAALAQHPLVRTAVVTAQGKDRAHRRLVGYVVPASKENKPDIAELREFIGAKLPDYMVPPDILVLEELPLSVNGKVDRKALPSPDAAAESNATVQGSVTLAEKLKTIFASVLGIPDAGIHTNFFEMGGDSILGIQIINRAREQGIEITPQQIFEHQTIAELATAVRTVSDMPAQGLIMGKVPLTQFQHWVLRSIPEPAQAARVLTLEAASPLNIPLLEQAFLQIQKHHDALRLRFHKSNGEWEQIHAGEDQLIKLVKLNSSSAVNDVIEELRANLDVSSAPLAMGCVEREQPLIICLVHELLADQLSWKILLQDLETAYGQLSRKEAVKLPQKRASFKQWAERIQHQIPSLSGPPIQSQLTTFSTFLDAEQSKTLLRQVSLVYNIKPGEALITALAQTLASQLSISGLRLDIEIDGRSLSPEGLDCTGVVGCFTTLSSVELNLKDIHDNDAALKSIKEQLRGKQSSISGKPHVLFSYFDSPESELSKLSHFSQPDGEPARTGTVFPHPLQLSCSMRRGCLEMQWIFDEQKHSHPAVQKLSDVFYGNLQNLIRHCTSSNGNAYSPSDFPEAEVDQEELDKFLDLLGKSTGGGL